MGTSNSKRANSTTNQLRKSLKENFPDLNGLEAPALGSRFKPAYFVGAGISKASGLPDFRQFGTHILADLFGDESVDFSKDDRVKVIQELRPEVLLQTLHNSFGEAIFNYYEWFAGDTLDPNINHYFLAKALKEGIPVLTTNVDCLIEKAYTELYGESVKTAVSEKDFVDVAKSKKFKGVLFKFHGSIDDMSSVRFLLSQVGLGVTPSMKLILEKVGRQYNFVMFGYSGCDNFSVQPVLRRLESKKALLWIWHDNDKVQALASKEAFQEELDQLSDELRSGKGFDTIPRGLETLSTLEVLSETNNAVRLAINTSRLIPEVTEALRQLEKQSNSEKVKPPNISDALKVPFLQLYCASELVQKIGANDKASNLAEQAKSISSNTMQSMQAVNKLGELKMIGSGSKSNQAAIGLYKESLALAATADSTEDVSLLEAKALLGLANAYRRNHQYADALETLGKLKNEEKSIESLTQDRQRIVIRKYLMEGLVFGLGSEKQRDYGKAIEAFDIGIKLSIQTGLVNLKAAMFNAKGLVVREIKGDDRLANLALAEQCLSTALSENIYIGDTRACFQQLRNLGLVHGQLDQWEQAYDDFKRAGAYLARLSNVTGEVLEAEFRQGEALVKLGRANEAKVVLEKVIQGRQKQNDWHNEARTLELLLKTDADEESIAGWVDSVIGIYTDVFNSEDKLKALKQYNIKAKNAKSILGTALGKANEEKQEQINALLQVEILQGL